MTPFVDALTFLRRFQIHRGELRLSSLLEDGNRLDAVITVSVSDALVSIRHTLIGEIQFASTQTRWTPNDGSDRVVDDQADNELMISRLRSGIDPRVEYISEAVELAYSARQELQQPLSVLRSLKNAFTAIVAPGVSWFNAELKGSPITFISFDVLRGHVSLKNVAIDLVDFFVGFELSILGAEIDGPMNLFLGRSSDNSSAPLGSISLNHTKLDLDAEMVVGLHVDMSSGRLSVQRSDLLLKTAALRCTSGSMTLYADPNTSVASVDDPLRIEVGVMSLNITDLCDRAVFHPPGNISTMMDGGPIRIWVERAAATKQRLVLSDDELITGPRGAAISASLLGLALAINVDASSDAAGNALMRLRSTFECDQANIKCDIVTTGLRATDVAATIALRHGRLQGDFWHVEVSGLNVNAHRVFLETGDNAWLQMEALEASLRGTVHAHHGHSMHLHYLDARISQAQLSLQHPSINSHLQITESDPVEVVTDEMPAYGNELSLAARVHLTAYPGAPDQAVIIASTHFDTSGFVWSIDSAGRQVIRLSIGGTPIAWTSTASIPLQETAELWMKFDGNDVSFYRDANILDSFSLTGIIDNHTDPDGGFLIGGSNIPQFVKLEGLLGDVQVWNRAYSPPYQVDSHRQDLLIHLDFNGSIENISPAPFVSLVTGDIVFGQLPFTLTIPSGSRLNCQDIVTGTGGLCVSQLTMRCELLETSPEVYGLQFDQASIQKCYFEGLRVSLSALIDPDNGLVGDLDLGELQLRFRQIARIGLGGFSGLLRLVEISPIDAGDIYRVVNSRISIGKEGTQIGTGGFTQKLLTGVFRMGGGSDLIVKPSQNNRLRMNSVPLGAGEDGMAVQLSVEKANLTSSTSGNPDIEFENIQLDVFVRNIAQELPDDLRGPLYRAFLRFALLFHIEDFVFAPTRMKLGIDIGALLDTLRQIAAWLNKQIDLGGIEHNLRKVFELVDNLFELIEDVTDIWIGFEIDTLETQVKVFTGNLPDPIPPTADNQIMLEIRGGTNRIRGAVTYKYPKIHWQGIRSSIKWERGENHTDWVSIFFRMSIYLRLSFAFDTTTRRILITNFEFWFLQTQSNTFTAAVEEGMKAFLDVAINTSGIKQRIIDQINSRLSQNADWRLPDDWDIDLARVQVSGNGIAVSTQATITSWNSLA